MKGHNKFTIVFIMIVLVLILVISSYFLVTISETLLHVLSPFAIALVIMVAFYLIRLIIMQRPLLSLDCFENKTDIPFIDAQLDNFKMTAKEQLIIAMDNIFDRMEKFFDKSKKSPTSQPQALSLQSTILRSLTDLTKAIEACGQEFSPVMQIIYSIFPRPGISVKANLLQMYNTPGNLGIAFEIVDSSAPERPKIHTIWCSGEMHKKKKTCLDELEAQSTDAGPYSLGVIYAKKGDFERARTYFEEALKQGEPNYTKAKKALECILQWQSEILHCFYNNLLPTATHWLAAQLLEPQMMQAFQKRYRGQFKEEEKQWEANVQNFFGTLYETWIKKHDGDIYSEAAKYFRNAVDTFRKCARPSEDEYQPYVNLANIYSIWAQRLVDTQQEEVEDLQHAAVSLYIEGLASYRLYKLYEEYRRQKKDGTKVQEDMRRARTNLLAGKDLNTVREDLELKRVDEKEKIDDTKARIMIGRARAKLLAGEDLNTVRNELSQQLGEWKPNEAVDASTLYYLACWNAIAYSRSSSVEDRNKAYDYLCYSLIRNAGDISTLNESQIYKDSDDFEYHEEDPWYYWKRVDSDPDFKVIRDEDGLEHLKHLKHRLWTYLCDSPDLHNPQERNKKAIDEEAVHKRVHTTSDSSTDIPLCWVW